MNPQHMFEVRKKTIPFYYPSIMTIMVTILSHIWWINFNVLLRNFITSNLFLSKLLKCKLSSIFEIVHTIPTCDIENESKRKTTNYCGSSLYAFMFTTCMISHCQGPSISQIASTIQFVGFPSLVFYTPLVHIFV
jgi:hypothetical protein